VGMLTGAIERHRFFKMPLPGYDEDVEALLQKMKNETAESEPLEKKTTNKDGEHTPE